MNMGKMSPRFSVEKEYQKNPDISPDDIKKLRQWLTTQPHLPGEHLDDLDLMIAYHCCEKSAEVAKQVLDLHFTLRTVLCTYFLNRRPDNRLDTGLDTVLVAPLLTPTAEGYRAVYIRLQDPDPRNFNFADCLRTFMMVFDLWQHEEGTWPGFLLLIDLEQMVLGHLGRLDIVTIKDAVYFVQECMLVKLKGVHFLNAISFMDKLMMLLKPFMKKKLLDLIQIHQAKSDSIYQFVPREAFPRENGGKYKDWLTLKEETIKRLYQNEEFFIRENLRRVNESLRPERSLIVADQFSPQGSFKKLDID